MWRAPGSERSVERPAEWSAGGNDRSSPRHRSGCSLGGRTWACLRGVPGACAASRNRDAAGARADGTNQGAVAQRSAAGASGRSARAEIQVWTGPSHPDRAGLIYRATAARARGGRHSNPAEHRATWMRPGHAAGPGRHAAWSRSNRTLWAWLTTPGGGSVSAVTVAMSPYPTTPSCHRWRISRPPGAASVPARCDALNPSTARAARWMTHLGSGRDSARIESPNRDRPNDLGDSRRRSYPSAG